MPGLESLLGTTFTVLPRTARLVVFPGWLLHYVHTYRGQRPRVSISCNVIFEPTAPFATDRHVGVTGVSWRYATAPSNDGGAYPLIDKCAPARRLGALPGDSPDREPQLAVVAAFRRVLAPEDSQR